MNCSARIYKEHRRKKMHDKKITKSRKMHEAKITEDKDA
jgi:tRNA A-37 threonylcarbamoyl transferase component Bud32